MGSLSLHDIRGAALAVANSKAQRCRAFRVTPEHLLQPKPFLHQPLQAGFVEEVVGEFFVGEHGEGGAFGSGGEFLGYFDGEVGVLADDGNDHADHQLQAADFAGFLFALAESFVREWKARSVPGLLMDVHESSFSAHSFG